MIDESSTTVPWFPSMFETVPGLERSHNHHRAAGDPVQRFLGSTNQGPYHVHDMTRRMTMMTRPMVIFLEFSNPSTHAENPKNSWGSCFWNWLVWLVYFSDVPGRGQKLVLWNSGNLEGRTSSDIHCSLDVLGEKLETADVTKLLLETFDERKHISMQGRANEQETHKITIAATRLCY